MKQDLNVNKASFVRNFPQSCSKSFFGGFSIYILKAKYLDCVYVQLMYMAWEASIAYNVAPTQSSNRASINKSRILSNHN